MRAYDVITALKQMAYDRGIPFERLLDVLKSALASAYRKKYGVLPELDLEIAGKNEMRVWVYKEVVEGEPTNSLQISLKEAKKYDPNAKPGDKLRIEIDFQELGRIAAQTARQTILTRLKDVEFQLAVEEFENRIGEIISGVIRRIDHRNGGKYVWVDLGKTDGLLPPEMQVKREIYKPNRRMKFFIVNIKKDSNRRMIIPILSRTHPTFVVKLLEEEIPELRDGIVQVVGVARIPGYKTKIAVTSSNPAVDPVYICLGAKGYRIQPIVQELNKERLEIIPYSDDPKVFISKALAPAKVLRVELDEKEKLAVVIVPDEQLSMAIGKEGANAKLAATLTGWRINIKSESQARKNEETEVYEIESYSETQLKISDSELYRLSKRNRKIS